MAARRSTAALTNAPLCSRCLLLVSGLALGLAPAAMAQRRTPEIQAYPAQSAPLISPSATPLARPVPTVLPVQPVLPVQQVLPVQPASAAGSLPAAATAPTAPASASTATAPAQPARLNTGQVTIESDVQRADQTTGVVTATGNVRIVYPDQRVVATARQAQYFSKEGRVVLSGDVDIVQEGGNLLRAEQVVYLVDSERLIAIPPQGQQVFSRLRMQQNAPATVQPPVSQSTGPQPAPVAPVSPQP